ncbi:ATP-binding protein, partial [candidate division WWE3 bacterium]|nr:ATP-binding protein [candidate division WWE3 bacterium]
MQHQITVSPEFFKKERNNYTNWKFAFWRELFQNSIDGKASVISITAASNGDSVVVQFSDNGVGFSAEVRDSVYFCLGKTNKGGVGDVGGFGKARIVVCFSQNSYSIASRDWKVNGEGGSYEIHDSSSGWYGNTRGCLVTVNVDAEMEEMDRALQSYLRASQLICKIKVNGTEWNEWCHRRRLTQRLSFGNVYVNKSGGMHQGYVVVRVNGIPMFTRYTGIKSQVVVEIDADKSRDVLLSNRDMLHSKYQTELDEFIRKISIDTVSGLRKNRTKWVVCGGRKAKVTRRKRKVSKTITPNTTAKLNPVAVHLIKNSSNP